MNRTKTRNLVMAMLALALGLVFVLGPGQAWAGKYKDASRQNKMDCQIWCNKKADCEFCSKKSGCGQGYTSIQSWTGRGKNWYACAKRETRREAGQRHREECHKWCDNNPACFMCSTKTGCGLGYRVLKSWTGRGNNYYACERREKKDRASQYNKEACNEYCKSKGYTCKCHNRLCHHSQKKVKTFGGKGENWYACSYKNRR
jgi:hypothetical protein